MKIDKGFYTYHCACACGTIFLVVIGDASPDGKRRMTLGLPHKENIITERRPYTVARLQKMMASGLLKKAGKKPRYNAAGPEVDRLLRKRANP